MFIKPYLFCPFAGGVDLIDGLGDTSLNSSKGQATISGMINHPDRIDLPLVLVVDDDKTIRILLRRVMEQEGYQVVEAQDGKEALDTYLQLKPDIVLLDALMPGMDGFSCCTHLQLLSGGDRTPILMITGLDDPDSVNQAFESGATDYITKPIQLPVLRQRVRRLMQSSRLMTELRQQTERERLLRTITLQIRESLNLDDVLNTTVHEVCQFLQADRVIIYQFGRHAEGAVVAESISGPWISLLGMTIQERWLEEGTGFYSQEDTYALHDVQQVVFSAEVMDFLSAYQIKASLTVPILQGDRRWGLLVAHQCGQPHRWRLYEIDALKQLSTQVAIAIRQCQLYQQLERLNQSLQRLASLDSLTQVANRRRFDEHLDQEWRRMAREQQPLSLILCDIDYFKIFNDTYGHQAGDECLQQVARAISRSIKRPGDLVARYGGEEFGVILPHTRADGAVQVGEEIRANVAGLKIEHLGSLWNQVTLSLGVATIIPSYEASVANLIAVADKALYQAKSEGRDRVVLGKVYDPFSTPVNLGWNQAGL